MATPDTNFFEIQRRAFMWHKDSTLDDGVTSMLWDADPNTVVNGNTPGETKLYSMPPPALYYESSGKVWQKISAPNTWVESGGGGTGTVLETSTLFTEGVIKMRVDYAGGTTPPAGTLITTQAEYDALGYDLKYLQDVIRIIPLGIGGSILATVADGEQLAYPNGSGFTGYSAALSISDGYLNPIMPPYNEDPDVYYLNGRIIFQGENVTEVEATQAGTSTSYGITRSVGTWTADEHKGLHVEIVSGAGAGERQVIAANDATTIQLAGKLGSVGVCTFRIVRPATIILSSTDGVSRDYFVGMYLNGGNIHVAFDNVQFGKSSMSFDGIYGLSGTNSFSYCIMYAGTSITMDSGYFGWSYGTIFRPLADGSRLFRSSQTDQSNYNLRASMFEVSAWAIELDHHMCLVFANDCYWREIGTGGSAIWIIDRGGVIALDGQNVLDGNGYGVGVHINYVAGNPALQGNTAITINNCSVGILAQNSIRVSSVGGDNNDVCIRVNAGGEVSIGYASFTNTISNDIDVDGNYYSFLSDLSSAGDEIKGALGSVLKLY